jgi:aspartate/methionine/tyrosine aminotransferase
MTRKVAERAGIPPFYVMEVMKATGERARAGAEVLHLEVGQPATGAPAAALEAAAASMRSDPLRYTDALGTTALRHRVSRWYGERYGLAVDPGRVAITSGASGACVLAFLACFDAGDRVAVAAPGYACYRNMLRALDVEVVEVPVDATSRFQITAAVLEAAVEQHGALDGVVVASPSNPTGTMLFADELAALVAVCDAKGIRLISDEIYHGITYGPPATTALAADAHAVVVSSFSKYFSMTGWRLGWLVLPDELVTPVERLAQNLTVAPPTLAQHAGLAAFDCVDELDGHVARYARNRDTLLRALADAGFDRVAAADGAFYLWVDVADWTADSQDLCRTWLDELGVAVTPGLDFDPARGHRFLRLSFAGSEADIAEAARRIVGWAASAGVAS